MSKFQKLITILFCAGMCLAIQPSGHVLAQSCTNNDGGGEDVTCTDNDGDGFALEGGACGAIDCDDGDDASYPFAPKLCDAKDNNCDGKKDYQTDVDKDDDGVPLCALDCDDNNPNIYPYHQEGPSGHVTCSDNIDNDCDYYFDEVDTQCLTPCLDIDEDGYGQNGDPSCTNGTQIDCNDINPDINPGIIDDNCDNVDDNCSGTPDDQYVTTPTDCGVGSCYRTGQIECQSGEEIDTCTPGDPVYEGPQGDAKCFGGLDEDCDELIDEEDPGCLTSCIDQDGDGYGIAGDPACPNGTEIDCDDTNVSRNPGADDSNCNGFDEDCDLIEDDDFQIISTSCGVGACSSNGLLECMSGVATDSCSPGTPQPEGPYLDATCLDSLDNDCDGNPDAADISDCSSPDVDDDGDGWTENGGDCDDSEITIYPRAPKICDGRDSNCDGKKDYTTDEDKDGDGVPLCAQDCDDNDPRVSPGHTEGPFGDPSCSDCIDNNCNGLTDADDTGCEEPILCGNGTIDNGETCDDGAVNGDTVCGCQSDCTYTQVNTSCPDGSFCNGVETCDGAGECQAGTPVDCSDGVGCTDDACDENVDVCVSIPNDANCPNDGEFCTGDEYCDQVNDCSSTGDPCAQGETCDEIQDICILPVECGNDVLDAGEECDDGAANGSTVCGCQSDCAYTTVNTSCADGAFCNGDETCDGAGTCQPGTPVDCSDGVACTDDSCDEVNDSCMNTVNDGNCSDDGQFCTGLEFCDAVNDCSATGDPCLQGETCDEAQDICIQPVECGNGVLDAGEECDDGAANGSTVCGCQSDCTYTPATTPCADGAFCNGNETCDGAGICQSGTAVDCSDGVGCTDDSCDEVNDTCMNAVNDGNCSDDGQFCTGVEFCDPVNDCSSSDDPCLPGETCDELNDVCAGQPSGVDLDIKRFTVTKSVKNAKDVSLKLEVRNEVNPDGGVTRPATIIGIQNGVQVFTETQQVYGDSDDAWSLFHFGPYSPTASGDIMWTAIIADDDPDDDTETAVTHVN